MFGTSCVGFLRFVKSCQRHVRKYRNCSCGRNIGSWSDMFFFTIWSCFTSIFYTRFPPIKKSRALEKRCIRNLEHHYETTVFQSSSTPETNLPLQGSNVCNIPNATFEDFPNFPFGGMCGHFLEGKSLFM